MSRPKLTKADFWGATTLFPKEVWLFNRNSLWNINKLMSKPHNSRVTTIFYVKNTLKVVYGHFYVQTSKLKRNRCTHIISRKSHKIISASVIDQKYRQKIRQYLVSDFLFYETEYLQKLCYFNNCTDKNSNSISMAFTFWNISNTQTLCNRTICRCEQTKWVQ